MEENREQFNIFICIKANFTDHSRKEFMSLKTQRKQLTSAGANCKGEKSTSSGSASFGNFLSINQFDASYDFFIYILFARNGYFQSNKKLTTLSPDDPM